MDATRPARVFTIPPDAAFLPALARAVLGGGFPVPGTPPPAALELADWTLLLPTRRAVAAAQDAFLAADPGRARLLPTIAALGDSDEEEAMAGAAALDLPPEIGPVERRFVLAGLILDWARAAAAATDEAVIGALPGQALALAGTLGELIDRFDTEGVGLDEMAALFGDDLPRHRVHLVDFLAMVRERYPAELGRVGRMGPAERRSAALRMRADDLAARPSPAPLIAAGSTGSIPATAELLATVARLPAGAVVLPGLDRDMDDASWQALGPQHPQYGLRELLRRIGIDRAEVADLPGLDRTPDGPARVLLAGEAMRPTATTDAWRAVAAARRAELSAGAAGVREIAAPDQRDEAAAIALVLRKAVADGRRAALVTPDRRLARRVAGELARWGLGVDDSAGEPLARLAPGTFFRLVATVASPRPRGHHLVDLLRHPLFAAAPRGAVAAFEIGAVRGSPGWSGIAGLAQLVTAARTRADEPHTPAAVARLGAARWDAAQTLAERLETTLGPFARLMSGPARPLAELVEAHAAAALALAGEALWEGEAGTALKDLVDELAEHAGQAPTLDGADYLDLVAAELRRLAVRPPQIAERPVHIYGLLEARLMASDVVVLGGLNEGIWPGIADPGPWLNRPQHAVLGLQLPERRIGLAAHDFVQAFAAGEVWLTRSRKIDSTPAMASRWLMRLHAVLAAAGLKGALEPAEPWLDWAAALDRGATVERAARPLPTPPREARPRRLSVTAIGRLLRDPYQIYARSVLRLEPLPALDAEPGAAERGRWVHETLDRYARRHGAAPPADPLGTLLAIAGEVAAGLAIEPARLALWWPQVARIAAWYAEFDAELRHGLRQTASEATASHEFEVAGAPFTLTGIADRIDVTGAGTARVIDFKTGAAGSFRATAASYNPQLALEGWLLGEGAFAGLPPLVATSLMFVRLTGRDPAGEAVSLDGDKAAAAIEEARDGLLHVLAAYADEAQPYAAESHGGKPRDEGDYGHLSRWREWGAGEGDDEGGEAA